MSRSQASKSRLEKTRGGPSIPTPAITHDIIPGKFTELDWNVALDVDDSEDLVSLVMGDMINDALDVIYTNYLAKQLVPYTVALAKDAMLQIVEWQFLAHDMGEVDITTNETWDQDEEPAPSTIDAWAQGAMPKRPGLMPTPRDLMTPTPAMTQIEEEIKVEESEEALIQSLIRLPTPPVISPTPCVSLADSTAAEGPATPPVTIGSDSGRPKVQPYIPGWSKRMDPVPYKPYKGRIPSAGLGQVTESLYETELRMLREEMMGAAILAESEGDSDRHMDNLPASCQSILKVQAGRPPGNKEVLYDEGGNVLAVTRIPPDQLPQHRVRLAYRVVDPAVEAANARLEAMKKGRRFATEDGGGKAPVSKPKAKLDKKSTQQTPGTTLEPHIVQPTTAGHKEDRLADPLPLAMVDSIVLAPGVAVREGDRTKRGPKPQSSGVLDPDSIAKNLRPVKTRSSTEALNITDLINTNRISIKPLGENKPIPPIATV